jgi:dTDP-4-amino-4,6-dideoxygalactose transaminase
MIQQSRPVLHSEDFKYIAGIVSSRQVARGDITASLEKRFCRELGVRACIATSHGTAALHLALLALGVGEGDEVIIPSFACASLLYAVKYTGAIPVLVDIDLDTWNPTADIIETRIGSRTKAVIVTHSFGFPADVDPMRRFGVPIIEDCAQALGACYKDKPVGSWGDISVFSFYATKMICAGEGGMICTNDDRLANIVRDLNNPDKQSVFRVRYNYKMSDLTAGLALSQIQQLKGFVEKRRSIAQIYRGTLSNVPVKMQQALSDSNPVYYRFVVRSDRPDETMQAAREVGIECDRPVHIPLHRNLETANAGNFKNTEAVWKSGVSIPLYPDLSDQECSHIASTLPSLLKSP